MTLKHLLQNWQQGAKFFLAVFASNALLIAFFIGGTTLLAQTNTTGGTLDPLINEAKEIRQAQDTIDEFNRDEGFTEEEVIRLRELREEIISVLGDEQQDIVGPAGEIPVINQLFSRMFFGNSLTAIDQILEHAEGSTNIFPLDGNVGINRLNPSAALDVDGKIKMRDQTQSGDSNNTVATKGYVDSQAGGNVAHRYGTASHGTTIRPPSGFRKSNCSFMAGGGEPRKADGAYKRGRNYNTYWEHRSSGWRVMAAARFAQDNSLRPVSSGRIQYMIICTR